MLPVNCCGMSFACYTSEPNDKGVPRWSFRKFNVEAYRVSQDQLATLILLLPTFKKV